jgi:hypothetical protein
MYNIRMIPSAARFVRYAVFGAVLAAAPLFAQKQKAKKSGAEKPDRSYYAAFGYVMGAQLPHNYTPAQGRMVFARGQAHESRDFQKSFFIGDAQNTLQPDSLDVFFAQWGGVNTYCHNMILDMRAAKKTTTIGAFDVDTDIVLRNSADSVKPALLFGRDMFTTMGRVVHTSTDTTNGYVTLALAAEGGLAAFPHMSEFPPQTRLVTYAKKPYATTNKHTQHPVQHAMQVMNPAIHGARVDSYHFAEIATVGAPLDHDVFVTFVSHARGRADTVRIGDKIVYGNTDPQTPTLYVANIDKVAAWFLENKKNVPQTTHMPPRSNLSVIESTLRHARRHKTPYEALPPDIVHDLRALAVEMLSNPVGLGDNAPYGYELFGVLGSDAFRTYLMRPINP